MTIELILLIIALVLIFLTKTKKLTNKLIKENFAGTVPDKFYLKTDTYYLNNVKTSLTGGKYYYIGMKNNKLIAELGITKNTIIFTSEIITEGTRSYSKLKILCLNSGILVDTSGDFNTQISISNTRKPNTDNDKMQFLILENGELKIQKKKSAVASDNKWIIYYYKVRDAGNNITELIYSSTASTCEASKSGSTYTFTNNCNTNVEKSNFIIENIV